MVLLSISFENMHQILRNLYDTMTKLCHPMMDMAMALAALGALFYIAYRVWQSLSRAEPIDVFRCYGLLSWACVSFSLT